MNRRSRAFVLVLLLSPLVLPLSGCNTMAGMGQDIESAGNGIEQSAERNKDY